MRVAATIAEARHVLQTLQSERKRTLGLVPTMGALHEGHLALVRAAKTSCDAVAVSLFVNPTQFGPNEDLAKYPRTFDADRSLLEAEGVDLLFAPSAGEIYPTGGLRTFVEVGEIGNRLDGASRPGHFRGVATVVAKLFNIVGPDRAFFGQKDAAQVAVLRALVRDLNFPVDLVVCPTVRDRDGLALSSRNRYLSSQERPCALGLSRALFLAQAAIQQGDLKASTLISRMREVLTGAGVRIDYVEVIDADTLLPLREVRPNTLLAVAAWVGNTRLIDNLLIETVPAGVAP